MGMRSCPEKADTARLCRGRGWGEVVAGDSFVPVLVLEQRAGTGYACPNTSQDGRRSSNWRPIGQTLWHDRPDYQEEREAVKGLWIQH